MKLLRSMHGIIHHWSRRSLLAAVRPLVMGSTVGSMVSSMVACDDPGSESTEGVQLYDGALVGPDHHFRSGNGGGGGDDDGMWLNNGMSDPSTSGVDPAFGLSTSQGLSEQTGLLVDPDTLIVAQYLVECALPGGASISKTVDGQTIVLGGIVGLAPEWQDGSCDEDCQQWISACMLARTNVSEQSVAISLRADVAGIGTAGNPGFPSYEGSYFGNIFADERYVCRGNPGELLIANMVGRTCALAPELCGMEGYDHCMPQQRCSFLWNFGFTAADCVADGNPAPYHTISVYVHD